MIVCVCRGVSDREITDAIRRGACTLDDIARRCDDAGRDCGSCRREIVAQLRDGRTARAA